MRLLARRRHHGAGCVARRSRPRGGVPVASCLLAVVGLAATLTRAVAAQTSDYDLNAGRRASRTEYRWSGMPSTCSSSRRPSSASTTARCACGSSARRANVDASVARFWVLLAGAPSRTPRVVPMSAAIGPRFSDRYPAAAIIFDNMHAFHDVVPDLLSTPHLSARARRAAILRAGAAYRDSTTAVTSRAEWREMAEAMGVDAMGGTAPVRPL